MSRRRYLCIDGEMVEITNDYDNVRESVPIIGDRHYDGLRATDGANISTRAKHRAYMKTNGLTTVDDYTHSFGIAEEARKRFWTEGHDPSRRKDIERAVNSVYDKRRR